MASGLKRTRAAGYLAALFPLWALALARLWALLAGRVPGKLTALLALALTAGALALGWRLELDRRFLRPFRRLWTNLLAAGAGLALGAALDTSFLMADAAGTLLDHPVFHVLCALGSGLVCAFLVLALRAAARAWGRPRLGSRWQLLFLFLLVNALALFYLRTSATVYVWDNAGYWTVARDLAAAPLGLGQLRQVAETVVTQEYNYLLALPISWVMRLFGGSRGVFVLSIVNLYLLPALVGLCALGSRGRWGGAMLCLLFPGLTYLALVGFVDVAACAAGIWAVVFYTRRQAPAWSRGVLAGACLTLSLLLRRYFLFFALAFGLAALAAALYRRERGERRAFAGLFAAAAGTAIYAAQQFLVDKLTTDYGDLYSAYALGLKSDAMLFCRYFGYVVLAAALLWGLYRLAARREERGEMLLGLLQLAICFLLVVQVQSHGQQHTLLYVPGLALLLAPGEGEPRWKAAGSWALALLCAAAPLLPRSQPASLAEITVPDALPGFSYHGPRRTDIDQLLALSDYLDDLAAQAGGATCAVCASSLLLNSETLLNLRPSLGLPERPEGMAYIYVASVDKRDSFTWAMLEADYLVVGEPVQVHLGEENQQLIAIPAHAVLEGTGLGTAYARLGPSFTLQDGSAVYVYRRTRAVTAEERADLSRRLTDRYPDYAALYQVP